MISKIGKRKFNGHLQQVHVRYVPRVKYPGGGTTICPQNFS